MNIDLEKEIIERFIIKSKRDRYKSFVKSFKTREKFTSELAHFNDLIKDKFFKIEGDIIANLKNRIKNLSNLNDCYLISENKELDQKRLSIDIALEQVIGLGMGTLIIFGNAEIVYYEGEGKNNRWISKPN